MVFRKSRRSADLERGRESSGEYMAIIITGSFRASLDTVPRVVFSKKLPAIVGGSPVILPPAPAAARPFFLPPSLVVLVLALVLVPPPLPAALR